MVTTKRVFSLLVIAVSALGMVSCDSPLSGTVFTPLGNHSIVLVSGAGQSALRGQALPNAIVVKVLDTSGNPVQNEYVLASAVSGGGTVTVANPKSDINGNVSIIWTLGASVSSDILNVSISDASGNFGTTSPNINVTANRILSPASTANSSIVGTGPIVADGVSTSSITITLLDSNHEPLIGVVPTFSATGANNYLPCTPVNSSGTSTCAMSSSTLGTKTLSITTPINMTSGTVRFTAGGPSTLSIVGNTNNLLSVVVKDAYSNVVSGQQIDWAVTAGGGTLTGANSTTDSTGTASNIFTMTSSGLQTVTASVHGYSQIPSLSFSFDLGVWTFQSGNTAAYTLGNNIDFTSNSVCELTPVILQDNSQANFQAGIASSVVYGTLSDGVSSGLKMNSPFPKLTADWAPHWNNLVALWHFDDAAGSTNVVDSSASGLSTGSVAGATLGVPGRLGLPNTAAAFNSNSGVQQIAVADNASIGVSGNMTISMWIQSTTQIVPLWKNQHFALEVNQGAIAFASSGNWNWNNLGNTNYGLTDGNWHHIAVTMTSGVGYQFYADGVSLGTISTSAALVDNGSTLYIGSSGGYSVGNIDELAIWNTVLSASDIQNIYSEQSMLRGTFTSRVMDAKRNSSSTTLSWLPTLPFGKELPDNGVSETTSNYSSLANSTLMTGIAGLWHLDEPAGTTGAATVIDKSGKGNHGTPNGGISFGSAGKLNSAINLNGTNAFVDIPVPTSQTANVTMSAWFKSNNYTQARQMIFFNGSDAGGNGYGLALNHENENSGMVRILYGGVVWYNTNVYVTDSNWHFVTLTIMSDKHPLLYLDGSLVFTGSISAMNTPVGDAEIGNDNYSGGGYFNGSIDEVAIWTRALSGTEVQQLYQRGASRVKFQVQSCAQADCSDGTFQGPDGTSATYFSELDNTTTYNTTLNAPSGSVNAALPTLTFANFATPTPAPNRYFQYRAIFESDATSAALMPEIKSVMIGPTHYDPTSPTVVGLTGVASPVLASFTQTLGSNGCASATYNLGIGSSSSSASWYYWNGSAWAAAGGMTSTSSSASVINANLASFPSVGSNRVYFKAFLNSDGITPCELQEVQLNGHN